MGWRTLRDLAIADADELARVPEIGTADRAETIIEVANDAASGRLQLDVHYPEPEVDPEADDQGAEVRSE